MFGLYAKHLQVSPQKQQRGMCSGSSRVYFCIQLPFIRFPRAWDNFLTDLLVALRAVRHTEGWLVHLEQLSVQGHQDVHILNAALPKICKGFLTEYQKALPWADFTGNRVFSRFLAFAGITMTLIRVGKPLTRLLLHRYMEQQGKGAVRSPGGIKQPGLGF